MDVSLRDFATRIYNLRVAKFSVGKLILLYICHILIQQPFAFEPRLIFNGREVLRAQRLKFIKKKQGSNSIKN